MFIPIRPPEPPRVNYPEPLQLSEPLDIRSRRLENLVHQLKKGSEFLWMTELAMQKEHDAGIREVMEGNYSKQLAELWKIWNAIYVEVQALKNGKFTYAGVTGVEGKRKIGWATAFAILFTNVPTLSREQWKALGLIRGM